MFVTFWANNLLSPGSDSSIGNSSAELFWIHRQRVDWKKKTRHVKSFAPLSTHFFESRKSKVCSFNTWHDYRSLLTNLKHALHTRSLYSPPSLSLGRRVYVGGDSFHRQLCKLSKTLFHLCLNCVQFLFIFLLIIKIKYLLTLSC